MNQKQIKILFAIFIVVALILFGFIILRTRSLKVTVANPTIKAVDMGQLRSDYQQNLKQVYLQLESILKNSAIDTQQIAALKKQTLGLKVPKEFQDLHLKIVLLIDKVENISKGAGDKERAGAQVIMESIKKEYGWISK